MKNLFLALSMMLIGSAVRADVTLDPPEISRLGPGVVSSQDYNDLAENVQVLKDAASERSAKTLKVLLNDNQRIQALEADLDKTKKNFVRDTNTLYAQAKELERKVAGMQKQITILHAKKADK